jgi:hypothetical protein
MAAYMNTVLEYYEIFPKVLPVGEAAEINIRPLGAHAAFDSGVEYEITILPLKENLEPDDGGEALFPYSKYDWLTPVHDNGRLKFTFLFKREQEYYIRLYKKSDVKRANGIQFRVYAADADLYGRRPYKGDMHAHSTASDGRESPGIVMANYRKAGFDFAGLTDHRDFGASLAAVAAYNDASVDMCMCKGEEIHLPGNHVHIVNFCGEGSVQSYAESDLERFNAEVQAIAENEPAPAGVNLFEYAACLWIFRRIKSSGGLAILPHPHWKSNVYHDPDDMTDALFASGEFDAFELLGGIDPCDINTQTAYYHEARAKGRNVVVVGSSDSHGTINRKYFNWYTTVLFAKELSADGIREAVRSGYSVAVEHYPGENARVHGPYRLVCFTLFLLSEYFPVHDEMCFEEGRQMKDYMTGEPNAPQILEMLSGRTAKYLEKIYRGE